MATAETETEKTFAELICESCGAVFDCGANIGECWCFNLELQPEMLTELREKFKDCLCEECLRGQKEQVITEQNDLAANELIDARR